MDTVLVNNKLGRIYSLKSKLVIDSLFETGVRVSSYPFVVFYKEVKFSEKVPFKLVVSAPKRAFKFAYQRNRIKRIMKETVRLNKHSLEVQLVKKNTQIAIFLLYSAKEDPATIGLDFQSMQKKTGKLFDKIIQQLND